MAAWATDKANQLDALGEAPPAEVESRNVQDTPNHAFESRRPEYERDMHDDRFQPFRPEWPHWRSGDDRPVHRTLVEVPARDRLVKTRLGLVRYSTGYVRYSAVQGIKFRADAADLARLLRDITPHNSKVWTIYKLESTFRQRVGRPGSWSRYHLCFKTFLALFPKTFELYGPSSECVRVWSASRQAVVESEEEVMKRLAWACDNGVVLQSTPVDGDTRECTHPVFDSEDCCAKVEFRPKRATSASQSRGASKQTASTRPTSAGQSRGTSKSASRPASSSGVRSRPSSANSWRRPAPRLTGASDALHSGRPASANSAVTAHVH